MAYLEEIIRYKTKLLAQFDQNKTVSEHADQILSYPFIPGQTQKGTYVTFDMYVPQIRDKHLKDLQIVVNVFSHGEHVSESNRVDLLCGEIDGMLNGSPDFGIEDVKLVSVLPYSPAENYYGKQLTYAILDFNQKKR